MEKTIVDQKDDIIDRYPDIVLASDARPVP